jgi:hypothetical protein
VTPMMCTRRVEAAIPATPTRRRPGPRAALFPNAQAYDSVGMARLANYLGQRGSYAAARRLQQRIADAHDQALGPEHPETLSARNSLAC